jgi:hypothetical protein
MIELHLLAAGGAGELSLCSDGKIELPTGGTETVLEAQVRCSDMPARLLG